MKTKTDPFGLRRTSRGTSLGATNISSVYSCSSTMSLHEGNGGTTLKSKTETWLKESRFKLEEVHFRITPHHRTTEVAVSAGARGDFSERLFT